MEHGSVRNFEQIQESDVAGSTPRAVTILLVALGAGCIVFAALALGGKRGAGPGVKTDPLGDLVSQQAKAGGSGKATELSSQDVTFPGILSDEGAPTTALAAVKGNAAAVATGASSPSEPSGAIVLSRPLPGTEASPPPPTDRLPVVPLPAQSVLDASPVITRPRDSLTRAANDAAQIGAVAQPAAPPGKEGGYQLQVSSFRSKPEAEQFAAQLRARGHKAYVVEAHVANRGTWYRVRIGPFSSQQAAASYRAGFEGREHVVPFIVQPRSSK